MRKGRWIAAMFAFVVATNAAAEPRIVSQGPATQFGATQYVVHSERVGRDFLIKITPPMAPVAAGQKRPVIYALDGGYELAGPVGWELAGSGAMAPAFIVSIGYLPADFSRRDGDLNFRPFTENGRETPAGGPAFEAFLLDELEPFIAARFPVDNGESYLFGHSLGGLFAAEILAERPTQFRGYIIASPAIRFDPDLLGRLSAAAAKTGSRRAFVAVGGAEKPAVVEDHRQLVAALTAPGSRLAVTSRVYEGASHLSYYPQLVVDAFPWLLPPAQEKVDAGVEPKTTDDRRGRGGAGARR